MTDCLFCKIVNGTIPSKKIYEDEYVYAFHDIDPKAPVHILIIPKKHISGVPDLRNDDDVVIGRIMRVAHHLAQENGIATSGYRVVVNSGKDAGQAVFHIHYHLLGGRHLAWPPG
ncbi:MAG: histidine triad nucleotide-binding protein [Candidatus Auribacterota bacterium]|nr:histidine triad nucleotide-binding protein [Candidatus Auribacterota bacterium]